MSRNIIFKCLCVLNYYVVFAQMNQFDMQNTTTLDIVISKGNDGSNPYEGSPYLDDRFYMAKVNEYNDSYPVRYNASEDRMEVKVSENRVIALDHLKTDYVVSFLESGTVYKTIDFNGTKGYFIEIWEGDNIFLLKKVSVKYFPEKESTNGYSPAKPARFVRQKDVYYVKKENDFIEVPNNVNKLGKMLKRNDLKTLAKNDGLDISEESDLIK